MIGRKMISEIQLRRIGTSDIDAAARAVHQQVGDRGDQQRDGGALGAIEEKLAAAVIAGDIADQDKGRPEQAKTFSGVVGACGMRPTNRTWSARWQPAEITDRREGSRDRPRGPGPECSTNAENGARGWTCRDLSSRSVVQVVVVIMPFAVLCSAPEG